MRLLLIIIFVHSTTFLCAQKQTEKKAIEVFQKMLIKLHNFKTIQYKYDRILNYASENYRNETGGEVFLDFNTSDTAPGFKYQVENAALKSIYNGSESFYINKADSTIKISFTTDVDHVQSLSLFTNSILTLKKALQKIINADDIEKKLSDTTINNKSYYLGSFILRNKTLNNLGDFFNITLKRSFQYKIVIDKTTLFPLHIIQTNDAEPGDYILTSFSDIKTDIILDENSWYYSTYSKRFKPVSEMKVDLIKLSTVAPLLQGSFFSSNDTSTLRNLKGKVTIVEFWIKNCGSCIGAVPELNSLMRKYTNKVMVIGINSHDRQDDLHFFYQKYRPLYKTLIDKNGSMSSAYGVSAFPTFVVIDKKGVVVYVSEGFDKEQLDSALKKALN